MRVTLHRFGILLLALLLVDCALVACTGDVPEGAGPVEALRVGVLPDESSNALLQQSQPLFDFLSQEIHLDCQIAIPGNYEALLERFGAGQIDLAYFGGLTFIQAEARFGAIPLVLRDADLQFTSLFFVREDDPARRLEDLRGRPLTFGARLSTSGHLMPRHFLRERLGIVPEAFFASVDYSGRHDLTVERVRGRRADVGVANAAIVGKMAADGRLPPGEVRIIWETPPYTDYVWAVHPRIDPALRKRILQAFLALDPTQPDHAAILAGVGAQGFLPVTRPDFASLRRIAARRDLLEPSG